LGLLELIYSRLPILPIFKELVNTMLQEVTVFCLRLKSKSEVRNPTVWKYSSCHQVAELFFSPHLVEELLLLELVDHVNIGQCVMVMVRTTLEHSHKPIVDVVICVRLLNV
jgi:hypothetical protein